MIRWLVALASVLAVLVLIEDYAVERQRQHDALHGTLRPLATVNKANVAGIVAVAGNGRTWRYMRVDSTWRYPAYFDAFVQPQRIDHLLNSLLQASASVVSSESRDMQRYGLLPNSPTLTLRNPSNSTLLSMRLGRGAPDIRSAESYVQLVGADTIYHLHANPAHAFDSGDPPMLDLRVRPRALKRKAINRISFSGYPNLKTLYREQREMEHRRHARRSAKWSDVRMDRRICRRHARLRNAERLRVCKLSRSTELVCAHRSNILRRGV